MVEVGIALNLNAGAWFVGVVLNIAPQTLKGRNHTEFSMKASKALAHEPFSEDISKLLFDKSTENLKLSLINSPIKSSKVPQPFS